MLSYDYTRKHNEVVECVHLLLCYKYDIVRSHSAQETASNKDATITVDRNIKIEACKPVILVRQADKRDPSNQKKITSKNQHIILGTEKNRSNDLLANHRRQIQKMKTCIIPWVVIWDSVVTKTYKYYLKELEISPEIKPYMQSIFIKKILNIRRD